MSTSPIASYAFLSWARHGLGGEVQNAPAGSLRGTISAAVTIRGARIGGGEEVVNVTRQVALYGPGDIIGIDPRAIVRTEPRPWITNFENNYLPFVEFYDEDFPWRYTPAAPSPDQRRLTPWIALVVLEEDEFEETGNVLNRPLPFIKVSGAAARFPPADQLWAWAHVHLNDSLSGLDPNDLAALSQRLEATLAADRDRAYARLLCPRALKPNAGYHAFVVPAFEPGRLAGLGLDPAGATSATKCAWDGPTIEPEHYPYYHRWYFRTGSVGDFEYLVRLLQPKPADPRVGTRDIDVQAPGPGMPGIENPELAGVLRLGGALRVPLETLPKEAHDEFTKYDEWARPFPQPFQQAVATLLNLPATYAETGADDDPVIVPPIYGRWHAAVARLLDGPIDPVEDRQKWLNELNLDPRYRVAAGFGTDVIQKHQDEYMEAAWRQVGDVLAGNQKIRYAQMALAASQVWNTKHLAPALARSPERYLTLAAPVHRRVLAEGVTLQHRVRESPVPPAAFSKTMRQVLRPRGRVAQRAGFDATRSATTLVSRVNRGEVTAAPPKLVPPGLPTSDRVVEALRSDRLSRDLLEALRMRPWLRWAPLAFTILLFFVLLSVGAVAAVFGIALVAGAAWLARWLERAVAREDAVESLLPGRLTPDAVDRLPRSPDFRVGEPGALGAPTVGDQDSEDARRFKAGLRSVTRLEMAEVAIPAPVRTSLPLGTLATGVFEALKPERTIPARTFLHVAIPARIRDQQVDELGEVMVYPEIDAPMYAPLTAISSEMFLPNIQLIEVNSITLLETNQKFIEAYMVGLNHELASELLWREYPTDQRGSYFRQFWDVSGFFAEPGTDPAALRERLRDIPEVHRWLRASNLGDHDHREAQGDKEEELVLVIRGELLKKYPTAVVYAHRADWQRTSDGAIDKGQPRRLKDLAATESLQPPRDIVKTPLYEAKVDPDIYFFGFDLTARIAKGGFVPPGSTEEDPGWFFVIKERPGEPRFGLDLAKSAPETVFHVWNALAWSDVMIPFIEGASLRAGQHQIVLIDPGIGAVEKEQYEDDKRFAWRTETHAAELAYILYQVPVLMAVHASEMLPKDES